MSTLWEYLWAGSAVTSNLYRFNWDATDSSWNARTMTTANLTYADWKFWQSWVFNGTNTSVYINNASSFSLTWNNNATISAWFYMSDLPSSWQSRNIFFIAMDNPSWSRYFYRYYLTNTSWTYSITSFRVSYNFPTAPSTWVWYNIVFTTDTSQNNILYLDWVQVASATANDSATAVNAPRTAIWISRYWNTSFEFWNWRIDEVIMETRTWTPVEVQKYFTNSKWRFGII